MSPKKRFLIGEKARFFDRQVVIEVEILDAHLEHQLTVIDQQGYVHVGNVVVNPNYDLETICSMKVKQAHGYKPKAIPVTA